MIKGFRIEEQEEAEKFLAMLCSIPPSMTRDMAIVTFELSGLGVTCCVNDIGDIVEVTPTELTTPDDLRIALSEFPSIAKEALKERVILVRIPKQEPASRSLADFEDDINLLESKIELADEELKDLRSERDGIKEDILEVKGHRKALRHDLKMLFLERTALLGKK
jgi:hypothetical protein